MPPVVTSVGATSSPLMNRGTTLLSNGPFLLKQQLLQALTKYIPSVRTSTTVRGLTDEGGFARLCGPRSCTPEYGRGEVNGGRKRRHKNRNDRMPVRKIPKNHLVVTGAFPSRKNAKMRGFESPLEKEFMLLLEFDSSVASFEEQPLTIQIPGIPRGYTPDFFGPLPS